jgi:hypothetical protein
MSVRSLAHANLDTARKLWGNLPDYLAGQLQELTTRFALSVCLGDFLLLEGRWYVTHAGLLRLARRHHCAGISAEPVTEFCDPNRGRWTFRATVYKSTKCRGFVGFGDADPTSVSLRVRGAEMRVAETRAVNRALRKAYGVGLCSVEELGETPGKGAGNSQTQNLVQLKPENGQPRLRDRLRLLIREHQLDASEVKRYAAEYCQVTSLRNAKREQIESLLEHLTAIAAEGHDRLLETISGSRKEAA